MKSNRRTFLKQSAVASLGLTALGPRAMARSASDIIMVGVMGVNSRGHVLAEAFAKNPGAEVAFICDVDSRAALKTVGAVSNHQKRAANGVNDIRRVLDVQDVDAIVIAAPDHWHAPATWMALDAGKHVYVEKPMGHNAMEGELVLAAQEKHGKIVQMGNQQRSAPETIEVIQAIHEGLLGRAYYARAWYANTRGPIGTGKPAPVPDWLNYELWQGPAPRTPYRDNVIHYNWHWFWHWGTGEICNNGTHELDVCRWALQVDYPTRVQSAGGRYHYNDDWEAYDTQIATYDFEGGKSIIWEGRSCNGFPYEGRGRGSSIHGENGTAIIDRDGYVVYDNDRNVIAENIKSGREAALDTRGGGSMTERHIDNFLAAIRGEEKQNAQVLDAHQSVLLCHLGNIAHRSGSTLNLNPQNGHILNNEAAQQFWGRTYEPGWEPQF